MGLLSDRLAAEVPEQVGHAADDFVSWLDNLDEPVAADGSTMRDVLAMPSADFAEMASQAQG